MASFHDLSAVSGAHLVIDGGAPGNRWELLHIELDVVHLEVALWGLTLHQAGSYSASVGHALWEHTDVGNDKV